MKKYLIFCLLVFSPYTLLFSQGCSDAGICTIQSFQPKPATDSLSEKYLNQLSLGGQFGKADHDIRVGGLSLQYYRSFGRFSSIDMKLQFLSQSGNDITTYGLSDLYFNANWKLYRSLMLTTGFKLPLINGDIESDLGALPMDYQPSLGTVDAILGFSYSIKKLQLSLVAQQPLSDNENQFLVENHPPNSVLREFQSTNQYKRKGDVMLRVSYALPMGSRATVSPSVQPVYHLGNDEYTDASGNQLEIEGSDGLTLNINLHVHVRVARSSALALSLGAPVITRDVRPDGLTRSFVAGLDYQFRF